MLKIPINPFPTLTTERLILRQLSVNDDKEILALRSNPEVNKYIGRQPPQSVDDARNFIRNIDQMIQASEGLYWAVALATIDKLVGTICLFNVSSESGEVEIGFELLPTYQGRGIMQEAVEKVLTFGINRMGIKSIRAHTHRENIKSIILLEKFNFVLQKNINISAEDLLVSFRLMPIK